MTKTDLDDLIGRLETWSMKDGTFHGDRQLADEVLIAEGWRVVLDNSFEGGFRWSYGTNPEVSISESYRPHVVNDMNAAMGIVPPGCNLFFEVIGGRAKATVWAGSDASPKFFYGISERPSIAVVIASLRYRAAKSTSGSELSAVT